MNIFRICGDMVHLLSIFIILVKITTQRNCAGISLKTQELYALVFICRYLDIFWNFISLYNSLMKLFFLGSSFAIVYYIRYRYYSSYDVEHDTFRIEFLILPCFLLALLINEEFSFFEKLKGIMDIFYLS